MILVKCTDMDRQVLAGIKIDPATIEDDGTDYAGIRIKKPWGHEVEKYKDANCSVWWLHIHSHCETSMHCHPNKTTLLVIVGGEAILTTLSGQHPLSEGDMVVIEKGAFHKTSATDSSVVLYEVESPPNKRDLVRMEDSYGRGQGYETVNQQEAPC